LHAPGGLPRPHGSGKFAAQRITPPEGLADKAIESGIANHFEDGPAEVAGLRPKKILEASVNEGEPVVAVDHEQAILQGSEDGVGAGGAFRYLLVELDLAVKKMFEGKRHIFRNGRSVQQKCARPFSPRNAGEHSLHFPPGKNPLSPKVQERNDQSKNDTTEKPRHPAYFSAKR
jgi:hypothetical protein